MNSEDKKSAIACTLNDDEFRQRRVLARQTIIPEILSYKRVENGLNLVFSNTPVTLGHVEEFVRLEKGCCGFLTFELDTPSNAVDETIELAIIGPAGATQFIDMFIELVEDSANERIKA